LPDILYRTFDRLGLLTRRNRFTSGSARLLENEFNNICGIPADFAKAVARIQRRRPGGSDSLKLAPGVSVETFLPVSHHFEPGELFSGKGVFLGIWSPHDRDGVSLGKTFNLYAAPHDLGLDENGRGAKRLLTYAEALKHVSEIRSLMGHDGADYKNDTELYAALKNGSYKGEWFIPARDSIVGTDIDDIQIQTDTLFAHKDKGAFENTFALVSGSDSAGWYWSCSERREDPSTVYDVRLSDGNVDWDHKDRISLSCRPLRAELRGVAR
jgi:hypothetical protein